MPNSSSNSASVPKASSSSLEAGPMSIVVLESDFEVAVAVAALGAVFGKKGGRISGGLGFVENR